MSFCTFNISRTFFVLWLKSNGNCQSTFSSAPPYNISTEADNLRQSWADWVTVRDMTSAWNLREHWPSPWWDFNIPYSSDHHRRRKRSVSFGVGQHEQNNYQYLWVQCGQQHRRDIIQEVNLVSALPTKIVHFLFVSETKIIPWKWTHLKPWLLSIFILELAPSFPKEVCLRPLRKTVRCSQSVSKNTLSGCLCGWWAAVDRSKSSQVSEALYLLPLGCQKLTISPL